MIAPSPPAMAVDDSFKKPGAVPFKWEVKPGVPRAQQNRPHPKPMPLSSPPPTSPSRAQSFDHRRSSQMNSPKLRPPPAGYFMFSPVEPRAKSFRSPRVRSERWRFERPLLAQPESVSTGCFLSPLLRRMTSIKKLQKRVVQSDYASDLETSGKSLSPFHDSRTSCSSSRSTLSSPRPVSDPEWAWAGYGLF